MAYSIDLRIKIVDAYERGEFNSQSDLSEFFGVSLSTLKRWLRRKRVGDNLKPKIEGKGRPSKIDERGFATIKILVEKNPNMTLGELSEAYYKKHHVKVGTSILFRALKNLNFSHKKISVRASEKDNEEVKKKQENI